MRHRLKGSMTLVHLIVMCSENEIRTLISNKTLMYKVAETSTLLPLRWDGRILMRIKLQEKLQGGENQCLFIQIGKTWGKWTWMSNSWAEFGSCPVMSESLLKLGKLEELLLHLKVKPIYLDLQYKTLFIFAKNQFQLLLWSIVWSFWVSIPAWTLRISQFLIMLH